jgi:Kinesin motor domain
VYKDKIYDLLSTSGSRAPLRIREDSKRGITEVGGLTKRPAASAEEALEVIQQVCTLVTAKCITYNTDTSGASGDTDKAVFKSKLAA